MLPIENSAVAADPPGPSSSKLSKSLVESVQAKSKVNMPAAAAKEKRDFFIVS
jgi:hypothetical protein